MLPRSQPRYRPLSTQERPGTPSNPQAQARPANEFPDNQPPVKAIILAVALLVVGIILLTLGGLHLRGHIYSKDGAGLGLLILGFLTFLPAQLTSIRHKLHEEAWAYHGMDAAKLAGANITAKTEAKLAAKGFHSHIEYTFDRQLLAKSKVCQITVLQPLPAGVYADPYELANVVGMPSTKPQLQLAAYHVFGKIDVEKIEPDCEPTVLSVSANISIASLYLSAATLSAREPEAYHLKIPLHARYPVPHSQHPGHSDLYHNYTIEAPTVMLRCLDPLPQQTSGAATVCQDVCYVSSAKHDLRWTVPVGLDKHARLTQIATSAVAVGSLLALLVAVVSQPRSSISQTVLKQT